MKNTLMDEYKEKLVTADEAVKVVKSGNWVQVGEFMMHPKDCYAALARRKDELVDVKFRGTTVPFEPAMVKADPDRQHFVYNDWHFSGAGRKMHEKNQCNYIPIIYHEVGQYYRDYLETDVAFIETCPMDEKGFFNVSVSNSMSSFFVPSAKKVIVETNSSAPYCYGGNSEGIHISDVDYIVESSTNPKLPNLPNVPFTDIDNKIAANVMEYLEDGCCIQLGIGAMPNAIGAMIAQSDLKDLGVHTEMLADSFVDMYEAGRINGKKKQIDKGKMVYTFAMGSDKLYNFLHKNPTGASYPVSYSNSPYVMGQNDKVFAINNCLEVDLYGQVASESAGIRQISGTGGQFDFIFGAFQSRGGKGFICLSSTVTQKDGTLASRIVPTFAPGTIVTLHRALTSYVATEYGVVNLKGKTTWERTEALISIAHPQFRDELIKQADSMRIWRRSSKI